MKQESYRGIFENEAKIAEAALQGDQEDKADNTHRGEKAEERGEKRKKDGGERNNKKCQKISKKPPEQEQTA